MEPTLTQLVRMMDYMGLDSHVIQHMGLPLPFEADGENYRPDKLFRIYRNGTMEYRGWGLAKMNISPRKLDVTIGGIPATQRWISRAHLFLSDEVRHKINAKIVYARMPNVGKLILKFNKLEFIDLRDTT